MEEHFFHELRVLNVASGNTLGTCLHTSLRELDRYQAVYPIPGQELVGNNYRYTETPEARVSFSGGRARSACRSQKTRLGFPGVILIGMTTKDRRARTPSQRNHSRRRNWNFNSFGSRTVKL